MLSGLLAPTEGRVLLEGTDLYGLEDRALSRLRSEKIGKSDGYNRYYISGGKLHEMTKETTFGNHKSFLEIATSAIPAGAKVSMTFTDWNDIEATGIESVNNDNVNDDDNLYNLQGQRVNTAGKGIYIKNGKKILVK
jgi:hypothetical protein